MIQPLKGIKVIDLTSAIAGPYCTLLLGDLGAEVIKIEEAKAGDMLRNQGPFLNGEGAYFLYGNRNKKSLTLNLQEEKGRDILMKLVRNADILVENYRPQVKFRLKIDYETLKKINPRLIYCSVSGFGQTGPWADRAGFDQIAQGLSGFMSITGFAGSGPCRVGVAIGDSVAAMFAAYGILAALLARKESGVGQYIETSLLEALVALLGFQSGIYFGTGKAPPQLGNDHGTVAPYGTYRTQDGYINIAAGTQRMWEKLCQILELDELLSDPRFRTIPDRVQNKDDLRILLEKILLHKPVAEWVEILNKEGIPCGPILTIDQVFKDEQVLHQKMLLEVEHATAGKIKMIGFPVKMSESPCQLTLPPPAFGQHTHEILKGLDYADEEIEELKKNGII